MKPRQEGNEWNAAAEAFCLGFIVLRIAVFLLRAVPEWLMIENKMLCLVSVAHTYKKVMLVSKRVVSAGAPLAIPRARVQMFWNESHCDSVSSQIVDGRLMDEKT